MTNYPIGSLPSMCKRVTDITLSSDLYKSRASNDLYTGVEHSMTYRGRLSNDLYRSRASNDLYRSRVSNDLDRRSVFNDLCRMIYSLVTCTRGRLTKFFTKWYRGCLRKAEGHVIVTTFLFILQSQCLIFRMESSVYLG